MTKRIIKLIFLCFLFFFLMLLFANKAGFYETKLNRAKTLTEEQINYISKIKETIEMYTQEKEREHEIDTGMSNESQNWYQEHYTGMRR